MSILLELFFELKLWYICHSIEHKILCLHSKFQDFWTILTKIIAKKTQKNRYFKFCPIFAKIRFLAIFFERIFLKSWNLEGKYKIWCPIEWYMTLGIKKKKIFFDRNLTFSVLDLQFSLKVSFKQVFFCFCLIWWFAIRIFQELT